MNNLSLTKLSITVIALSFASNLVFADNDINKALVTAPVSSFSQLLTDYNSDDNQTLSVSELAANEELSKLFAKIDVDGDKEISAQEYSQYLASLKMSL
ncbi:hypothetical protein SAMN05216262_101606 [Colwellia chukchiensis]|uniref:EF-hand domain-containing protein n=1 Tax=Colwellia chukchiensis TaxID=641665 RepID=A0A1H7HU64_9GAMM|nr:hypothetical protein [Colwellia chukchiensis]SEK53893.1 hypothetical protein SAMN05216262_101606 [Colwellia chukchiensis]